MPPRMSILHSATRQLRRRGRHQHKHQPLNRLRQTNAGNLAFISVVSAHKRRASDGFRRRPLSGRSFAGTPTSPWLPLSAARSPSASDLGFSPSRKSAHAHALTEVFACCRLESLLHFSYHIYPLDPFKKVFLLKFTFVLQSAEETPSPNLTRGKRWSILRRPQTPPQRDIKISYQRWGSWRHCLYLNTSSPLP